MCMILHRIQHPEHRIQKVKNAGRGTTVIGEGKSMRHARSSCPAFRSGRKRAKGGEEVGLPGLKRAGMVKSAQFRPLRGAKNRLGPPWPTFAHIDFFEAGFGTNEGNGLLEWWSIGPSGVCQAVLGSKMGRAQRADFRGKKCGFFGFPSPPRVGCPRGVVRWRETWSHFSAVFHEFTHRSGPYLRDFTHFYGYEPF